jgi:hypothetical protein
MLLGSGASVNAKIAAPDSDTPLHLAISGYQGENRYLEAAKILLEFGADVNAKNGRHKTPLHIAICIRSQREDMIQLLMDFGAEIDNVDESEESSSRYADFLSAYWWAISDNKPRIVQLLIEKNPRLVNEISEDGFNGFEMYMRGCRKAYEDDELYVLFVELGLNPFKRHQDDQLSCFELGMRSRREVNHRFLGTCLNFLQDHVKSLRITFTELRIATEIDKPDLWTMLEHFLKDIEHETDEDGWNIHHFLHQARPRRNYSDYEEAALNKTLLPTTLIWPATWERWSKIGRPRFLADRLEVVFEGKRPKPQGIQLISS